MMHFVATIIRLARIENALFPVLSVVAGLVFAGADVQSGAALLCVAMVFLLHSAVTIWNDLCDYEVDAKNGRPFVADMRGTRLHRNIVTTTAGIVVICIGLSLLVSWTAAVVVAVAVVASWLYNARPYSGSRRPVASILLLSGTSSFIPFVLGYMVSGGVREAVLVGAAWWLMRVSLSLLKDYKDAKGDAASGKRTFLLAYGASIVRRYSVASFLIGGLGLVYMLVAEVDAAWQVGIPAAVVIVAFAVYRFVVLAPAGYAHMHRQFVRIANYQLVLEAGLLTWIWYS